MKRLQCHWWRNRVVFFSVSMDTCVNTAGSTKSGTSRVTMKPGNGESADHEIRHIEIIVVKITSEETKTF